MDDIDITISKYLSGEISDDELSYLFEWVNSSEDNGKYFNESKVVWTALDMYNGSKAFNTGEDFARMQRRLEHQVDLKESSLKKVFNIWQKIAAVLILPIVIAGLLMTTPKEASLPVSDLPIASVAAKEMYTPVGVRAKLELYDGTTVWLNSNSRLKYFDGYVDGAREVELQGEAYFDVAHDDQHPFVITARGLNVKVLGTSFNVNTYDPDKIETTLVAGSVQLVRKNNQEEAVLLKPGFRAIYKDKSELIPIEKVDAKFITAWKDDRILFFDTPMSEVIITLERWYHVKIQVKDEILYDYHFTANLKDKSLSEVLDLLKLSSPIGYKINGKNVIIYNKKK